MNIVEARNEIKIIERKLDEINAIHHDNYNYQTHIEQLAKLELFTDFSALPTLLMSGDDDVSVINEKYNDAKYNINLKDQIAYLESITDDNEYYKMRDAYRAS